MQDGLIAPHGGELIINMAGEMPPREFSRPEVAQVLIEAMRNKGYE